MDKSKALEISKEMQAAINAAAPSELATYREMVKDWSGTLKALGWSYSFTFPDDAPPATERAKAPKAQAPESPKEAGQDLAAKMRALGERVGGEAGAAMKRAAANVEAARSARAASDALLSVNPALAAKLGALAGKLEAKP